MLRYNLPADTSGMDLSQLLRNINAQLPITVANGLTYDRFPPVGFHTHLTMSWIYMPLILQAANGGTPVIDLLLPPDLMPTYSLFVQRLQASSSLPALQQFFRVFDAP